MKTRSTTTTTMTLGERDRVKTYLEMLRLAEVEDRRGDVVMRDQHLRSAEEFAATRLGSLRHRPDLLAACRFAD